MDAFTLETIARAEYMSYSQIRLYSMNRLELLRFTRDFILLKDVKKSMSYNRRYDFMTTRLSNLFFHMV